jgi:hypothetical protein
MECETNDDQDRKPMFSHQATGGVVAQPQRAEKGLGWDTWTRLLALLAHTQRAFVTGPLGLDPLGPTRGTKRMSARQCTPLSCVEDVGGRQYVILQSAWNEGDEHTCMMHADGLKNLLCSHAAKTTRQDK